MSTKSDDKATITITGGDDIDKRLLAHFIVQQLRRAIAAITRWLRLDRLSHSGPRLDKRRSSG